MNISKILFKTEFLQLKSTPSPLGSDWFYAHRPNITNIAVILPILHEKDNKFVLFIETQRPPITAETHIQNCIELPAGLVGDENKDESLETAALRELLEETGYKTEKIKVLTPLVTSSGGMTSETAAILQADIYNTQQIQMPVTDGGIILAHHKVPIANIKQQLRNWQKNGKAISAQVYAALYLLEAN